MSSTDTFNSQFLYIPRPAFIASLVLHLSIPVLFLVFKVLSYFDLSPFQKRTRLEDVYQEYIQVDMVALPDLTIKELEKVDVTAPVDTPGKAEDRDSDAMVLAQKQKEEAARKEEAKKKEAEEKKRREAERKQALKKLQEEAERESALKALQQGEKARPKLKGNIASKGTSAVGNLGTAKDQYTSILMERIRKHFTILPSQEGRGLVTTVRVELYKTGRVKKKEIVKSSNESVYDSSVLQAIDVAQPFPIPEDPSVMVGGFVIVFEADKENRR